MNRTVVINVVGLSSSIVGKYTPFLTEYLKGKHLHKIKPVLPALTTSTQSTYLTGKWPSEHGIVANGWYDRRDSEIKFWKQSNPLVQAESVWDIAKRKNPNFTCAQMFWWYNMYNRVEYSATPRPNYLADGRKMPDCYTYPAELRDELQEKFGQFPLFKFWGAAADITSSRWIANAAMYVEEKHRPTLNLIYLPQLDYCQQKYGPHPEKIAKELTQIDELLKETVTFFEERDVKVILLSEYGIVPVNRPIHINRILRKEGLLGIRVERGLELLDAGASDAFSVSDHQIAHIYTKSDAITERVKKLLEKVPGVDQVLDKQQQTEVHIAHERSGDLVILAKPDSWFTYYFWEDDSKAPDYARNVDIHKKPGYDPVEMFMTSKSRALYKLIRKKLGFRYTMDIVPLNADLVKGSHGLTNIDEKYFPIYISGKQEENVICPTHIQQKILEAVFGD